MSEITWPWDDNPNWGKPREGATSDPADQENWRLACGECALYFPADVEMSVVADHWTTLHHPEQLDHPKLALDLVWVGLGEPPEARDAA